MELQEQQNGGELSLYPAHNPNNAAELISKRKAGQQCKTRAERFGAAQSF